VKKTVVVFIALMIPTAISAQSFYCSRPSEPYIRSGWNADWDQMGRSEREVEDYLSEMDEYRECLANEYEDAGSEAERVIDEWNRAVRNFNNQ
jgi:hypothetical protein